MIVQSVTSKDLVSPHETYNTVKSNLKGHISKLIVHVKGLKKTIRVQCGIHAFRLFVILFPIFLSTFLLLPFKEVKDFHDSLLKTFAVAKRGTECNELHMAYLLQNLYNKITVNLVYMQSIFPIALISVTAFTLFTYYLCNRYSKLEKKYENIFARFLDTETRYSRMLHDYNRLQNKYDGMLDNYIDLQNKYQISLENYNKLSEKHIRENDTPNTSGYYPEDHQKLNKLLEINQQLTNTGNNISYTENNDSQGENRFVELEVRA